MNGGPGTTPRTPGDDKLHSAVLCHARLPNAVVRAVMWWMVGIGLLVIVLAFSPMLASVSAALALVALLVWRLALLC